MTEQTNSSRKTTAHPGPVMMSACQSGGCGGGAPPPMPPPPSFSEVRVNGVEVLPEAIAREIQHHPASDAETALTEAARALAIRELLLQETRRLGIEAVPEPDEAGRVESDEDAMIAALLDQEVTPALPSEDECRRYYEAQRQRFRTPDLFEAAHILIEPEGDDDAALKAAKAQAEMILAEVGNDPTAFAEAAREFSTCPSAAQDGTLGQIRRGELVPQMQQALEKLQPGETYPKPVQTRFGWHVVRLARRIEGQTLPFEVVHEKVADMLGARSWSLGATRYVAHLAAASEIEGIAIEPTAEPGNV